MTSENNGFAARWSKRKIVARQQNKSENLTDDVIEAGLQEPDLQNTDLHDGNIDNDAAGERVLSEADFDDVDFDKLDKSSDYTRFLKANVPAAIQKRALRKLWASDSVFEVLDGMNDYDEDFTGNGLAGKVFKSAYKIGRGYLDDDDIDEEAVENDAQTNETTQTAPVDEDQDNKRDQISGETREDDDENSDMVSEIKPKTPKARV